jgi:hypothetical protein
MWMYGSVEVQHHIFFAQMEVSSQLHPQGMSPQYPFDRRVGGSQSWTGHCGKEKLYCPRLGSNPSSVL